MKNYEKIKNMSVKEMSRFIYDIAIWLESEVKEK